MTQQRLLAGRYRLVEPLGRGGMGTVWRAVDELLGRDVAVKEVILPRELSDAEREVFTQRTIREARAAGRVSHHAVAAVFDMVEEDGRPWIVLALIPSRSLAEVTRQDGPLPPWRVAQIGLTLLSALRTAHTLGVLHRDVKPSNVLIADDGRVVLTDFGIATLEGDPSVTRTGTLVGTPSYIAPERALGGQAKPESDLWSLGATLYAAVEGRPPFERGSAIPTMASVIHDPPEPITRAGALTDVLLGLLRKEPAERLPPDQVRLMLERIAAEAPADGHIPKTAENPRPEPTAPDPVTALDLDPVRPVAAVPPAGSPVSTGAVWAAAIPHTGTAPAARPESGTGLSRVHLFLVASAVTLVAVILGVGAWMATRDTGVATPRPPVPAVTPSVTETEEEPTAEVPPPPPSVDVPPPIEPTWRTREPEQPRPTPTPSAEPTPEPSSTPSQEPTETPAPSTTPDPNHPGSGGATEDPPVDGESEHGGELAAPDPGRVA
ncbi:serine/threonine-protein kinase [Rhizohabitans arisaemae]|uniref:serine/threonine-protein kinase n=1 Tax=Rhizohabitans arisaemae TaxID=2720610 RepID=UPI0024B051DF|nr:protein kinase [Rhizohabitans arisaemae]